MIPAPPPPAGGGVVAPCRNCGNLTPGNYCPECGQARRTRLVSLREMLGDLADDELNLNARLPRTIAFLLARPGFLTREYLRGRIARYVRPFRLYLGASVVFFVLLSLLQSDLVPTGRQDASVAPVDAAGEAGAGPVVTDTAWWSMLDSLNIEVENPRLREILESRRARFREMTWQEVLRRAVSDFRENVPTTVFLLLPVFAFLLKVLYLRRLYVEHFVFALHVHAFTFALFTLLLLLPDSWPTGLLFLWMTVYVFLAMRRVYGQSLPWTAFKYLALGFGYAAVLSVAVVVTATVTLLLL